MPTFFTPDKSMSSRMGTNGQNSPHVEMTDQMNVHQPNQLFQGNETIVEETNEAEDSVMNNSRFSQRFLEGNDDIDFYGRISELDHTSNNNN